MATFKAIIGRKRADDTYAVRIRVTHKRELAYIPADCYVHKQYVRKGKICDYRVLDKTDAMIRRFMRKCNESDIGGLDAKGIVSLVTAPEKEDIQGLDFAKWVLEDAARMTAAGHGSAAGSRITAINAFCRAFGSNVIPLSSLTKRAVKKAFKSITGRRAPSLYKAQLQASFNTLMKEYNADDVIIPYNPFTGLELPKVDPPEKRALDAETIKSIALLRDKELREGTKGVRFNLAKDVFMLSFYLVGMNAVDLYNCTEYKDGRITYERTKTRARRSDKALMSVEVPQEAIPLFEKYFDGDGRVFRFWRMYSTHGTFNAALNKGLKQVGEEVGIDGLTFYAARHSWATIAVNDCGIDKWTVHLALNHVDPVTAVTDIYIKKSWKPVDEANRKVIEKVFG